MHVNARAFWAPKAGNRVEEYEDAFWPVRGMNRTGTRFRFAVADGATETSFSALWAQQLVRSYGAGSLRHGQFDAALRQEQARWRGAVSSKPLPWYAEAKVLDGAYAALLGLELHGHETGTMTWQALAVGDCCLMHVRGDALLASFPATDAGFFTSRPYLLSSNPASNNPGLNGGLTEQLRHTGGACQPGDRFFLMTDALAHWFLHSAATGKAPWRTCRAVTQGGARRFGALVDELRSRHGLRNDDVTLLVVELP